MKFVKLGVLVFILLGAAPLARACQVSVLPVNFGAFDNLNNPLDSNGQVNVQCPVSTTLTVHLNAGGHSNSLFQSRKLSTTAGQTLNYNLYLDSARVLIWGDGTGGSQIVSRTSNGTTQLGLPVYGRIASGQLGSVGVYGDAITVTVIW